MNFDAQRSLAAEALGTAFLVAGVVGSGIMAERLAGGNAALALIGNTAATGAVLYVLILVFGPVSGAHFNPAVTLAFFSRGEIGLALALRYAAVQILGGLCGVVLAHAMFTEPLIQVSLTDRGGPGQWLGEFVATFGLLTAILGARRWRPDAVAACVGLYISAGYWFTSSTSFANPAVTLARSLTASFTGIAPRDVLPFVVAQILGALVAARFWAWLIGTRAETAAAKPAEAKKARRAERAGHPV
jgi:glycerol uptake facilitator-like aquaporin